MENGSLFWLWTSGINWGNNRLGSSSNSSVNRPNSNSKGYALTDQEAAAVADVVIGMVMINSLPAYVYLIVGFVILSFQRSFAILSFQRSLHES